MRAILPGLANDTISMVKLTSIASIIFVNELTFRAQQIVAQNFKFFTVFVAAGIIYLAITSAISLVQMWLERRFDFERERMQNSGAMARLLGLGNRQQTEEAVPPAAAAPIDRAARSKVRKAGDGHGWIASLLSSTPIKAGVGEIFVECRNVWKSYGNREVLRGVNFGVKRGEVVTILGPSGSGKSTLLRMINHLEPVDRGEILVDGAFVGYDRMDDKPAPSRDLAKARADARIGMVFPAFQPLQSLHGTRECHRGAGAGLWGRSDRRDRSRPPASAQRRS